MSALLENARAARLADLHELLAGDVWIDRDEQRHDVAAMQWRHARRVIGYLERRAGLLHSYAELEIAMSPGPLGDMAQVAFEQEQAALADVDALEWLWTQPLLRALAARCTGAVSS